MHHKRKNNSISKLLDNILIKWRAILLCWRNKLQIVRCGWGCLAGRRMKNCSKYLWISSPENSLFEMSFGNIPKLSYPSEGWLLIIKQFGSQCLFFKPNPRVIQESWVPGENKRPQGPSKTHASQVVRASLCDIHPCSTSFKVGRWPFYSELTIPWGQQSELMATRVSIPFWSIENTVLHVWIQGNSLTISLRILCAGDKRIRAGYCYDNNDYSLWSPKCLQVCLSAVVYFS